MEASGLIRRQTKRARVSGFFIVMALMGYSFYDFSRIALFYSDGVNNRSLLEAN